MGLWKGFRPSSVSHTTGSICCFLNRENKYVGLGKANQHLILHFTVLGLWCQLRSSLFKQVYLFFFSPQTHSTSPAPRRYVWNMGKKVANSFCLVEMSTFSKRNTPLSSKPQTKSYLVWVSGVVVNLTCGQHHTELQLHSPGLATRQNHSISELIS